MGDNEITYLNRTVKHIRLVQDNMLFLITKHSKELNLSMTDRQVLMYNVMQHDVSKFNYKQYKDYIAITEYYKNNAIGTWTTEMQDAWIDHYKSENHHPIRLRNDENFTFDKYCQIECCCDLQAMSQENGEPSCLDYFSNQWIAENKQYLDAQSQDTQQVINYMRKVIQLFHQPNRVLI